jgi:hypothetical protein
MDAIWECKTQDTWKILESVTAYLSRKIDTFQLVDDISHGISMWHGCYMALDFHCHIFTRSGMTVQGFQKRWKLRLKASWLNESKENQ